MDKQELIERIESILLDVNSPLFLCVIPRQRVTELADAIATAWIEDREKARQEPVGDAIEVRVPATMMQFVLSKCRQSDKTIAKRTLVSELQVRMWRESGCEEQIWRLRVLASLTGRYNWTVFLLKPENLAALTKTKETN